MVETGQEKSWIEKTLQGDHAAFEQLITSHQRMIYSIAYRMTGSASDAEDVAQETFIRAFRQLESFRGESKFSSWLCQIAVNLGLNWRAHENRRGEAHSKWSDQALNESSAAEYPDELSRQVQEALNKLPPKQRAAIVLTVYENHNHAEAARLLNCAETTVSWRVFAARRRLKRLLKGVSNG